MENVLAHVNSELIDRAHTELDELINRLLKGEDFIGKSLQDIANSVASDLVTSSSVIGDNFFTQEWTANGSRGVIPFGSFIPSDRILRMLWSMKTGNGLLYPPEMIITEDNLNMLRQFLSDMAYTAYRDAVQSNVKEYNTINTAKTGKEDKSTSTAKKKKRHRKKAVSCRYARVPEPKACRWCLALATREGEQLYTSKQSAGDRSAGGTAFHPHCKCDIVPVWGGGYPEVEGIDFYSIVDMFNGDYSSVFR